MPRKSMRSKSRSGRSKTGRRKTMRNAGRMRSDDMPMRMGRRRTTSIWR